MALVAGIVSPAPQSWGTPASRSCRFRWRCARGKCGQDDARSAPPSLSLPPPSSSRRGSSPASRGRLLRPDHGLACAVEGEQRDHLRRPRPRRLDRRRAGAPGRAAVAELAADRQHAGQPTSVDECARCASTARRSSTSGASIQTKGGSRCRRHGCSGARCPPSPTTAGAGSPALPAGRRAGVHARALRARDRRPLRRARALRRARRAAARLQHARRDGLRRDGPLPGHVGLPARAPRIAPSPRSGSGTAGGYESAPSPSAPA